MTNSPLSNLPQLAGYPDETPRQTRKRFVDTDADDPVIHTSNTKENTRYHRAVGVWPDHGKPAPEGVTPFDPTESRSVVVQKMDLPPTKLVPACAWDHSAWFRGGIKATSRTMADKRFEPCAECYNLVAIRDALADGDYEALRDACDGFDARAVLPEGHPGREQYEATTEHEDLGRFSAAAAEAFTESIAEMEQRATEMESDPRPVVLPARSVPEVVSGD